MALSDAQGELFAPAKYVLRPALIGRDGGTPLMVIGCSRDKRAGSQSASNLYVSSRFKASLSLSRCIGACFVILSGKHGIVMPDEQIESYDLNVSALSNEDQMSWAHNALEKIRDISGTRRVTILAENPYASLLVNANNGTATPLDLEAPWLNLVRSDVMVWLAEASRMAVRIRDLKELYLWIDEKRKTNEVFRFRNLASQQVPRRGVYVFLDPREPNFLQLHPRIVRIGTHGVSRGSMATLRGRLRNHLGPGTEIGNHRGSVFRLHLGRAMLEEGGGRSRLPSWGEGQDAAPDIKAAEVDLELAVTRYLQQLEVAFIAIDDEPTKDSLRAKVEAQLIALCSEGLLTIDYPAADWLGLRSPVAQIKQSGLWNVRGVGGRYEPASAGAVGSILGGILN